MGKAASAMDLAKVRRWKIVLSAAPPHTGLHIIHTLEQVVGKTQVKHVILATMGDLLGGLKGTLVNLVVRKVKKMVPAYSLPGAVAFNKVLADGARVISLCSLSKMLSPGLRVGYAISDPVTARTLAIRAENTYLCAPPLCQAIAARALSVGLMTRNIERVRALLALEPAIPVSVKTLRPTARPHSLVTRAFTRCMAQALQELD